MELNKQEKISVILPVYNVGPYLQKCLDSILTSSYRNLEVICINDGSTDHCLRILLETAEKDSRVIVVDQKNQGVSAARNSGLSRAAGDYIAFIDPDDYIHPEYFRTMMKCMKARHADIVICGSRIFKEGETIRDEAIHSVRYHRLTPAELNNNYYGCKVVWARIYRKEALSDNLFVAGQHLAEDTLFNLNVIKSIRDPRIYETKAPLYYYLSRKNSLVNTRETESMLDAAKWYLSHRADQQVEANGWEWILPVQMIKLVLSYRYMVMYMEDHKKRISEADYVLAELLKEIDANSSLGGREKRMLHIMYRLPAVYRLFRIINDPTLLDWEKKEKKTGKKQRAGLKRNGGRD